MIQYPMQFFVSAQCESGLLGTWKAKSAENRESINAIPPEFGGPGGGYSPEDYFALAILNCYMATFKVFAQNSKIEFDQLETKGTLTIDKDENGFPWMKHFALSVKITGAKDKERMQRLAEKTLKGCLVHNSVKTQIVADIEIA